MWSFRLRVCRYRKRSSVSGLVPLEPAIRAANLVPFQAKRLGKAGSQFLVDRLPVSRWMDYERS